MGKTHGQVCSEAALGRGQESSESGDGEITLLSEQGVENIDDLQQQAAGEDSQQRFGDDHEHQAIVNIISHLRTTERGQRASSEQLEDLAIDLYNRVCQGIRGGQLSEPQIAQAAKIFGQRPEQLQQQVLESR
jgi:hypothetical protein